MSKRMVCMGAGAVEDYVDGHIARIGEDVTLIAPPRRPAASRLTLATQSGRCERGRARGTAGGGE